MSYGFNRGKAPTARAGVAFEVVDYTDRIAELKAETKEVARSKGFTGNQCTNCGSIHMQIAGHCEVCTDCGTTTGCS